MSECAGCGNELQEGDRFCSRCGAAAAVAPTAEGSGASRIELDANLLNSLLALAGSKPGGPKLSLQGGQLMAQVGEHSVVVNPIRLNEVAQVLVSAGTLGNLKIAVDVVHLGERGLEVQLRLA